MDNEKVLESKIKELNDLMQLASNNIHFGKYNPEIYDISKEIIKSINHQKVVNPRNLPLANLSLEDFKKLTYIYYNSINSNPNFNKKVRDILENNISFVQGRSFQRDGKIFLETHNPPIFEDLIALVHEVAHAVKHQSGQNVDGRIAEVEATMAERMFFEFLKTNHIEIINENGINRALNDDDLKNLDMLEIQSSLSKAKRAVTEIDLLKEHKNNGYTFDKALLERIYRTNDEQVLINRVEEIKKGIKYNYLSNDPNFDYTKPFDLHNGRQLSNETRFIYALLIDKNIMANPTMKQKYGEYLVRDDIKDLDSLAKYFGIELTPKLVNETINNISNDNKELLEPKMEVQDFYFKNPTEDRSKDVKGKIYIMPPNEDKGFRCGYSMFIPDGCQLDTTLLVHCCNTGGKGVKDGKLDNSKSAVTSLDEANEAARLSSTMNAGMVYAWDLKMPVLTPIIPRVRGYYTHALGSKVFNNDVSTLIEDNNQRAIEHQISDTEIKQIQEQCRDLPTQLANIIADSKVVLKELGVKVDDKVIIEGYSAGSKFTNGFTALHPELVKACISGGNSGMGILPIKELNGQTLNFPLGVADVPNFDAEAFKSIPQYYYIGRDDYNDPAMLSDKQINPNKPYQPKYIEQYTPHEMMIIHTLLGTDPQVRFDNNQKMYEELGVIARFQKFNGNHNTVTMEKTPDGKFVTNEAVEDFIKDVISKEKSIEENLSPQMVDETKLQEHKDEQFDWNNEEEKQRYEQKALENQEYLLEHPLEQPINTLQNIETKNNNRVLKLEPLKNNKNNNENKDGFISIITLIGILLISISIISFISYYLIKG